MKIKVTNDMRKKTVSFVSKASFLVKLIKGLGEKAISLLPEKSPLPHNISENMRARAIAALSKELLLHDSDEWMDLLLYIKAFGTGNPRNILVNEDAVTKVFQTFKAANVPCKLYLSGEKPRWFSLSNRDRFFRSTKPEGSFEEITVVPPQNAPNSRFTR